MIFWDELHRVYKKRRCKVPILVLPLMVAPLVAGCYAPPPPYAYNGPFYPPPRQFIPRPAPPYGGGSMPMPPPGDVIVVPPAPPAAPPVLPAPNPPSGGAVSGGGESWSEWVSGLLPRGGAGPDEKYGWYRINGWLDRMGAAP